MLCVALFLPFLHFTMLFLMLPAIGQNKSMIMMIKFLHNLLNMFEVKCHPRSCSFQIQFFIRGIHTWK